MKVLSHIARILLGALLLVSVAHADDLFETTGALALGDPTQQGRLSRNGVPTDWSGSVFPGVINPGVTYHYETFAVNVGVTPFIQITMDSLSANTFASAYLGSYDATNLSTNYLGDAGSSGNYFGTDPISFQVFVPTNDWLVIVINNTAGNNGGVGDPFHLIVQGYLDTEYTETPEPSSLLMVGSGVLGVAGLLRRKLNLG